MSYRNDTNATYDRTLLDSVPDPTRAERQEGYNVDLLDEGRDRRAPTPPAPQRRPTDQQPLTDGYSPGAVALAHKEGHLENGARPAAAKAPWYRTRWGITAIIIVIVLIIGAIVGGVVGGTHHSSHKSSGGNGGVGSGNPNANSSIISGNSPSSTSVNPNSVVSANPTGSSTSDNSRGSQAPAGPDTNPSSTSENSRGTQVPGSDGIPAQGSRTRSSVTAATPGLVGVSQGESPLL